MLRMLTMAGGIAGAVGLSQFPEFSQQYLQRLSGAVDELKIVVGAFDATAAISGFTRDEALAQLGDSQFENDLRENMTDSFKRFDGLRADYDALKNADTLTRLSQPWRFADADLVARTWDDFKPAVPVTTDGAISAGIGFVGGYGIMSALFALLKWPFRRRRRA